MTNVNSKDDNRDPGTEPCFRLIYRSRSLLPTGPEGDKGLAEILRVARENNRRRGLTGALMVYRQQNDRFAQVLEGPETEVQGLFARIKVDPRHDQVEIREAGPAPARFFNRWAMALVVEHGEPDVPLIATAGGLSEAAPRPVTPDQERVLTELRNMTRGYGRGY
jgi:hypothetical protein